MCVLNRYCVLSRTRKGGTIKSLFCVDLISMDIPIGLVPGHDHLIQTCNSCKRKNKESLYRFSKVNQPHTCEG